MSEVKGFAKAQADHDAAEEEWNLCCVWCGDPVSEEEAEKNEDRHEACLNAEVMLRGKG